MALLNVTGVVRAGTDPDLRFTPSGLAVAKVRAVASSARKNAQGEWEETGSAWYEITAFGELAEFLADKIIKGKRFHVSGRHSSEEWETKEGEKRRTEKIIADMIFPFSEKGERTESAAPARPAEENPWGPPPLDSAGAAPF